MKRRNFLKGLLGMTALPIAAKAGIDSKLSIPSLEMAQPMTSIKALDPQKEWAGKVLSKSLTEGVTINMDLQGLNNDKGEIITISGIKDPDGSLTKFRVSL